MIHIYNDFTDPNKIVVDNPRRSTTLTLEEAESLLERLATVLIETRYGHVR